MLRLSKSVPVVSLFQRYCRNGGPSLSVSLPLKSYQLTSISCYHTSAPLFKRKTGSKVNEFVRRPKSKKQKKKASLALQEKKKTAKRMPGSEMHTKLAAWDEHLQSDEFKDSQKQAQEEWGPHYLEMLKPQPKIASGDEFSQDKFLLEPNVKEIIGKLKYYKKKIEELPILLSPKTGTSGEIIPVEDQKTIRASDLLSVQDVDDANYTIQYLAHTKNFNKIGIIADLLKNNNLPIEVESYAAILTKHNHDKNYEAANQLFNELMQSPDFIPTPSIWKEKISLLVKEKNVVKAIELLETLQTKKIQIPITAHNEILDALVHAKRKEHEKIMNFWLKMHENASIQLNAASFEHMIHYSAVRGEVERAFFYFDELKSLNITPTIEVFCQMIQASARAPYWVSGYEESISDALFLLESHQVYPNVRIYNEIIQAYSLCGDSVSAEYYFWEMVRKGIQPNRTTINNLLKSYAKSNSNLARTYSYPGRFYKPETLPLSWKDEAMKLLGPARAFELFNSGIEEVVTTTKGGRRYRLDLTDAMDENPEAHKAAFRQAYKEAKQIKLRKQRRRYLILTKRAFLGEDPEKEIAKHLYLLEQMDSLLLSAKAHDNTWEKDRDEVILEKVQRKKKEIMAEYTAEIFNPHDLELFNTDRVKYLFVERPAMLQKMLPLLDPEERKRITYDVIYAKMKNIYFPKDGELIDPFEHIPELKGLRAKQEALQNLDKLTPQETTLLLPSTGNIHDDESSEESEETFGLSTFEEREEKYRYKTDESGFVLVKNRVEPSDKLDARAVELMKTLYGGLKMPSQTEEDLLKAEKGLSQQEKLKRMEEDEEEDEEEEDEYDEEDDEMKRQRIQNQISVIETLDADAHSSLQESEEKNTNTVPLRKKDDEEKELLSEKDDYLNSLKRQIDVDWDTIHYGRLAPKNFELKISEMRAINKYRATLIMNKNLSILNISRDEHLWNSYFAVFAEAGDVQNALAIREEMKRIDNVDLNEYGMEALMLMHVRDKNLDASIATFNEAKERGIGVTSTMYGLMLRTFTHHQMIVEALKIIEEADERGIQISERDIKVLRSRCRNLAIVHPNIPADPTSWLMDVRKAKRQGKHANERTINHIKSMNFM